MTATRAGRHTWPVRRRARFAPFVGREAELAEVEAIWHEVREGWAAGMVISGEAGIGKTRLLAECVDRIRADSGQVLYGMCVQMSSGGLPYGPILEALRRLLKEKGARSLTELVGAGHADLDRLLLIDEPLDDHTVESPHRLHRSRLFEEFLALLTRLAQDAPLLLVVEDVHWAEQSTLDLLAFLTAALRQERVMLAVTYRDDQLGSSLLPSTLLELLRSPVMTRLALPPLDLPELGIRRPRAVDPLGLRDCGWRYVDRAPDAPASHPP